MEIEEIKKALLEDRDFREKLFKLYCQDEKRFINKLIKEASDKKSNTSNNIKN